MRQEVGGAAKLSLLVILNAVKDLLLKNRFFASLRMTRCVRQGAARFILAVISLTGLVIVVKAVLDPDLGSNLLPLVALAFAAGPLTAGLRKTAQGSRIQFQLPPTHCVLFASALALGPYGAALPGAASGIARLLSGKSSNRPLFQVMHAVLKPAAVCSTAALAYMAAGGDAFRPQSVSSTFAVLCAGVAYIAASALAAGVLDELQERGPTEHPKIASISSAWLICLTGGYLLAVLYSVAPVYVLYAPVIAATIACLALREPAVRIEEAPTEVPETESGLFVDPGTGLASRRYLEMFLASEAGRAQRSGKPLSAAIFDLDNPRNLAENGREAIDGAVRILADAIKSGLRDYDLVARYSAGRLAVILPEAGTETAVEIVERLHETAAQLRFFDEPLRVTVGIATLPDHASNAQELIHAAHHALNRGRFTESNQVHSLNDLPKAS